MRAILPVSESSPLPAIQDFLAQLIRADVVDAVLTPMTSSAGTVALALVADPALLSRANPLAPVMGVNSAPSVGRVSVSAPRGRIAAVLRSCELRALIELVKLRQADLTDLLTVGIDCPGTYSVPTYLMFQSEPDSASMERDLIAAAAETGTLPPHPDHALRAACRMCEKPYAAGVDISVELAGADLSVGVPVSLPGEMAEKLGVSTSGESPDGASIARDKVLAKLLHDREAVRDASFAAIDERLNDEGMEGVFAACVRCHNCMTVCPACYCRTCLFRSPTFEHEPMQYMTWAERKGASRLPADTLMFHLTRLNHMALSCVGCGMCTSACPSDIPVGEVFRSVGQRLQRTFDYEPGRDVDEPLPLITFQENEWTEVGEE